MSSVLQRLSPQDFYRQLDWIRDEWACDEYEMTRKLTRLRRLYEQLPHRYYEPAVPILTELGRLRLLRDSNPGATLGLLRRIVSDWNANRTTRDRCPHCGWELGNE